MNNCKHSACPDCGAWLPHQPAPQKRTVWINIWRTSEGLGLAGVWPSRLEAERRAGTNIDRVGCVRVELEEGRYDE